MKVSFFAVGILSLLTPLTAAWTAEDREIFRIRDEIAAYEVDPAATFYDVLGISSSASLDDINKAYRKKTRLLHPDKVTQQLKAEKVQNAKSQKGSQVIKPPTQSEIRKAVKEASERQARLTLIAGILRGPSRDRYDHFLVNGFPLWKGTDYYYNRYRPGLGTGVLGLFIMVGGGIHYLILYTNWKRQRDFVERYIAFARTTAWGSSAGVPNIDSVLAPAPAPAPEEDDGEGNGPPQAMNRRQRRMYEKESRKEEGRPSKKSRKAATSQKGSSREQSSGPTGARKRVVAENGKILVVDSQGDVFLEQEDEEGNTIEYLLDPNELLPPTISDTAVVRVPVWLYRLSIGRFLPTAQAESEVKQSEPEPEPDTEADDKSDTPQATPTTDSAGEDFEIVDESEAIKAKVTGAQQAAKASKRKSKKR